jgi:hypothetical protein
MVHPHARVPVLTLGWVLLGLSAAGCWGEYGLADETYPVEPVAYLEGELNARPGKGPTAMSLAWAPDLAAAERLSALLLAGEVSCGMEKGALLQPMAFQPHFPSSFVLPLSTTPIPAAQRALEPAGGQGWMALGWVVSFLDSNQNGVLDLGSEGMPPERVMASSLGSGLAVLFLDGALPDGRSGAWATWPHAPPRGFSLLGAQRREDGTASLTVLPVASTSIVLEASRHVCP